MDDLVADVLADHALFGNLDPIEPFDVFPAESRQQGHCQRNDPHQQDHRHYPFGRPLLDVVDARYGPVSAINIGRKRKRDLLQISIAIISNQIVSSRESDSSRK